MRKATQHLTTLELFEDRDLPVALLKRDPQPPFPLHTHQFSELVLVFGGSGTHFTETARYEVGAGDVFVIQGDMAHGYCDLHDLVLMNILFDPAVLETPTADPRTLPGYHALFTLEPQYRHEHRFASRLRLGAAQFPQAMRLVEAMEEEARDKAPGYVFMTTAHFMLLVGYISRCYAESLTPERRPLLRIGEAIGYIENHSDRKISLAELARVAHMSQSSLLRAFRRATGRTPIDYQTRLRVRKACTRLRSGDETVTEIAGKVGFSDSNYFTRQFRKVVGMAPREYRRQSRSNALYETTP